MAQHDVLPSTSTMLVKRGTAKKWSAVDEDLSDSSSAPKPLPKRKRLNDSSAGGRIEICDNVTGHQHSNAITTDPVVDSSLEPPVEASASEPTKDLTSAYKAVYPCKPPKLAWNTQKYYGAITINGKTSVCGARTDQMSAAEDVERIWKDAGMNEPLNIGVTATKKDPFRECEEIQLYGWSEYHVALYVHQDLEGFVGSKQKLNKLIIADSRFPRCTEEAKKKKTFGRWMKNAREFCKGKKMHERKPPREWLERFGIGSD